MSDEEKMNNLQSPNSILSAIEARWGVKKRRLAMKLNTAKKFISKDNKPGSSNRQASSETMTQGRKCRVKSKIRKCKIDSNTHKHCSYSLSQPVLTADSTSSRHMMRNWQPPLKIFRYDHDATAKNFISNTMPSTSKDSGEEVNGNTELATDNGEEAPEKQQSTSYNDENQENISPSQQSTQEYIPKQIKINALELEEGKYEKPEMNETKDIEINSAIQEGGRNKVNSNSDQVTGTNPLNIKVISYRNSCNMSFTEHSEEKNNQCLVFTKHIQNNTNQSATTLDMDKEQVTEVYGGKGSKLNIMTKSDNIISPSDKHLLLQMNKSSHYEEEQNMKSSYDSVICQSSTVKSPQYTHSIRTLNEGDKDSLLPLDLILNHSKLTCTMTGEMEQLTEVHTMPQTTALKITEQKIVDNQCEGKGSQSEQFLTPQAETDKNNYSPFVTREVQQTVCNFQDKSQKEYAASIFMPSLSTTHILVNKLDNHLYKLTPDLNQPVLVAAQPIEICTVDSTKLQGCTEQADMETVTSICTVDSTKLQRCTEQADMETVTSICTVDSTKLQRCTEQADMETVTSICTVDSTKSQGCTEQADMETVTSKCTVEGTKLQECTEKADMETETSICTVESTKSQGCTKQADMETETSICTVESTKLQGCTEQAHMATVLPDPDPMLNQSQSTKMVTTNTCDMREAHNVETASATLTELEKISFRKSTDTFCKFSIEPATSNAAPYPITSTNKTDLPVTDNHHINDNCSKQAVKNANGKVSDVETGNMEPLRILQPLTPPRKEFLPKQDEVNQSTIRYDNCQNIFCKSPTAAMEAPNILGQLGVDPLTNEYIPDTASHSYLLDDDIGLTGSQLLRIEDQCQYSKRNTQEEWNQAFSCSEASIPDADMHPTPKWVQSVQKKRQKLRSIIGDISRINALLTRMRKEMWPFPHNAPTSGILKSGSLTEASNSTVPKGAQNAQNM